MTQREKFTQASFGTPPVGRPISEFPKLPKFIRERARSDEERKDLERYEAEVQEFFKKFVQGG